MMVEAKESPNSLVAKSLSPTTGLRITAAEAQFPGQQYTTEELNDLLVPTLEATSARLQRLGASALEATFGPEFLARLGVQSRALVVDPGAPQLWWRRECGSAPMARAGAACYRSLLSDRRPLSMDDKLIVVSNAYDTTCPNLATHILNDLQRHTPGFTYPQQLSLLGEGCSGFISALREANTHLGVYPESRVVIIANELTSQYFYNPDLLETLVRRVETARSDEDRTVWTNAVRGLFIQRLLFGDGVVAVICQYDRSTDAGLPLNRFRRWTNLNPDDISIFGIRGIGTEGRSTPPFGYFFQDPKRLFDRLQAAYIPAMAQGLAAAGHAPDAYAVHTGSGSILEHVFHGLQIPPEKQLPSISIFQQHGNMNSASGAAITAALLNAVAPIPKHAFLAFFGVGFSAQVAYCA